MRLFLYGTLQPAADTAMARWLRPRIVAAEPATVPGRLFAIASAGGWYPALLPGSGECRGTLVLADLGRADLARLDRYEGSEYRRMALRVRAESGHATCSGYVWRLRPPAGAVPIADGDFLAWLKRTRRQSYGS